VSFFFFTSNLADGAYFASPSLVTDVDYYTANHPYEDCLNESLGFLNDNCRHATAESCSEDAQGQALDIASTRPAPTCQWRDCSSKIRFSSHEEVTLHQRMHGKEVLGNWTTNGRCTWNGCVSKAKFGTRKSLQTHLENIHINPLTCTVPACSHKRPFRNNFDLERHKKTAHTKTRNFECPFPNCDAKPKAFMRRDKWLNHFREIHGEEEAGNLACPLPHCLNPVEESSNPRERFPEHIKKEHGNYECGLGSCRQKLSSYFSEQVLQEHLQRHHGMRRSAVVDVQSAVKRDRERTIRAVHVPKDVYCGKCTVCEP